MELAGEVVTDGHGFARGERICALVAGGAYAQLAAVPAGLLMRIPEGLTFEQAAAFPEVWMTAFDNLFNWGRLAAGETALVHGGGSGVGTAAIQLIRWKGARALVTAGSADKIRRCVELGAAAGFDYKTEDFVARAKEATAGRGVDVVLDVQGGPYLEKNLRALATGGRLVVIGLMGGARAELDLGLVLSKRLTVIGTTLRSRPLEQKVALTRQIEREILPEIAAGKLRVIVEHVFDLAAAADAHRMLEASTHFGKLVLRVPS